MPVPACVASMACGLLRPSHEVLAAEEAAVGKGLQVALDAACDAIEMRTTAASHAQRSSRRRARFGARCVCRCSGCAGCLPDRAHPSAGTRVGGPVLPAREPRPAPQPTPCYKRASRGTHPSSAWSLPCPSASPGPALHACQYPPPDRLPNPAHHATRRELQPRTPYLRQQLPQQRAGPLAAHAACAVHEHAACGAQRPARRGGGPQPGGQLGEAARAGVQRGNSGGGRGGDCGGGWEGVRWRVASGVCCGGRCAGWLSRGGCGWEAGGRIIGGSLAQDGRGKGERAERACAVLSSWRRATLSHANERPCTSHRWYQPPLRPRSPGPALTPLHAGPHLQLPASDRPPPGQCAHRNLKAPNGRLVGVASVHEHPAPPARQRRLRGSRQGFLLRLVAGRPGLATRNCRRGAKLGVPLRNAACCGLSTARATVPRCCPHAAAVRCWPVARRCSHIGIRSSSSSSSRRRRRQGSCRLQGGSAQHGVELARAEVRRGGGPGVGAAAGARAQRHQLLGRARRRCAQTASLPLSM
jgi:hypothetical protein